VGAWRWRGFDLDTAVLLAHEEARLIVRRRTIQDAAIVERELGSVPRTDDRSIFQRPLG
jgi:hypothetical protein